MEATDTELLRRYAREASEEAFAELVRRYLGLVYHAALRQLGGDTAAAEDVTQKVFTLLARKAGSLGGHQTLAGWLHTTTRFAASEAKRVERRRLAREQEAHLMHALSSNDSPLDGDWRQVRPLIDEALGELNERDREAVLLRFFAGLPLAEVGAKLHLTDNTARMRVERALEKLHHVLARRGITSTSAALGLVLANQTAAAVPAGLAPVVTKAAVAASVVQGGAAAAGGAVIAFMSISKIVTGMSVVVAVAATTVAFVEHGRALKIASVPIAAPSGQVATARVDELTAQLARAQRRVAEVEKDNDELLKAIASQKAPPALSGAPANAADEFAKQEQQRLAREREFQQILAKRKQAEAMERARLQETAMDFTTGRLDVERMLDAAEQLAARGDFQGALQTFNLAIEKKPSDQPLPERAARGLEEALKMQNVRVPISLISDGQTWVAIISATSLRQFQTQTMPLPPGNYEIIGRRAGYMPVSIPLQVRPGEPPPAISVVCTVPAGR